MVDAIVDVVEDVLFVQLTGSRPGILGVAVVGGQAVEVIDTGFWLSRVYPNWFSAGGGAQTRPRLLVVEDSAFFRQLLVPSLGSEGFEVTAVADAEQALALCHASRSFDAIISDIAMPGMSGLEFARRIRAETRWAGIPLIAHSSFATPGDVAAGREAGFTDCVEKSRRENLVASIWRCLSPHPWNAVKGSTEALAA